MTWQLSADSEGRSAARVFEILGDILDMREDDPDYEQTVARVWWTLAYEDATSFLDSEVDEYQLPEHKSGPKTEAALLHALKHFSIPQVRRQIKNVVMKAAALSTSRDYNKRHALNTIPGRLISYIDRAVSEGWSLSCLLRDWQYEEPLLLTVLFNRVLKSGLPGFRSLNGGKMEQLIGFDL